MEKRSAFTLVELSIVLVILGLLVGGVLTGQSLIRAAELRSISTQFQGYVTATQTFRDKYFALPGDMPNASAYWGAADGSTGSTGACVTTAGTGTATCNGNGDGIIILSASSNEAFRYWQHLANAGLIEGRYDGITHGSTYYSATLANVPAGKINSSLWYMYSAGTVSGQSTMFNGVYGNSMDLGGITANNHPIGYLFKPEDIYNIDTKMDDGKPATGKLVTLAPFAYCTNATSNADMAATYLLSSQQRCAMTFRQIY